jgi:hypothetical protein
MGRDRNTFAKRQREVEKKRKAEEKRERRRKKKEEAEQTPELTGANPAEDAAAEQ